MKIVFCKCKKCHPDGKPAKGHLDTQLFPECKGTEFDRDIVKKTVEKRKQEKKHQQASFNLNRFIKHASSEQKNISIIIYKSNGEYFLTDDLALNYHPEVEPEEIPAIVTYEFYRGSKPEQYYPGDKPSIEIKSIIANNENVTELYGQEKLENDLLETSLAHKLDDNTEFDNDLKG